MTAHKPATPLTFSHIQTLYRLASEADPEERPEMAEVAMVSEEELDRRANAYPKLVAALRQYVNVVESVNNPDNFNIQVADAGAPARDLLRELGEDA